MSIITRFWKPIEPAAPSEATIALSRTLRDEVVRYYQAGNLEDSLNNARQLLELQRQELGESHPDVAVGLKNVAALQRLRDAETEARLSSERPDDPPPAPAPSKSAAPPPPPELPIIDQVLALAYVGSGDPSCLTDAQRVARDVRAQAAHAGSPSNSLLEGFAALLKMVESGSSLGNDDWIAVHDAIARHFGRALAKAAASEKLVLVK